MNTRTRCQELFRRDEILRQARDNGIFHPQRGQASIAKRMRMDGLLIAVVGCAEVYRITDSGLAALETGK